MLRFFLIAAVAVFSNSRRPLSDKQLQVDVLFRKGRVAVHGDATFVKWSSLPFHRLHGQLCGNVILVP